MSTTAQAINIKERNSAMQFALEHMRGADSGIEAKNQQKLRDLQIQMGKINWRPASFINLHAFQLSPSSVLLNELKVPAAPIPSDLTALRVELSTGRKLTYTQHVFASWKPNMKPNDAGEFEFSAIMPVDLGLDILCQYYGPNKGGMLVYEGDTPLHLCDMKTTMCYVEGDRTGRTRGTELPLGEGLLLAHSMQVSSYLAAKAEADEAFNGSDEKKRNVIHRSNVIKQVRFLRAWGEIGEDPVWLKTNPRSSRTEPLICKSCGHEAKPGALRCTNGSCTYVFHPLKAFMDYAVGLSTPGAILALKRMSPADIGKLLFHKRFTKEELEEAGYTFSKKSEKEASAAEQQSAADGEPEGEETGA